MEKEPNKHQKKYYNSHKDDPKFKAKRNAYHREYRKDHPEVEAYLKAYRKAYYQANREKLDKMRQSYPQAKRNTQKAREYQKQQRDALSDSYVIRLLTATGKFTREEVTPKMIRERRKQVLRKRAGRIV